MSTRAASRRRKSAIDLVTELMAAPGRSGQEGRIADHVRRALLRAGVPKSAISADAAHRRSPIGGECGNLVVKLPGTVRAPRRLLMAHLDTVPLCVGSQPVRHAARIVSKNPATGLGADNRAGVAVVLQSVLTILDEGLPHPPLTLFFPVQEEIGLVGARYANVSKLGRPALCFNWDGGDPAAVTVGAIGATAMTIVVHGIASHAGVHPENGVSAAVIAGRAIAELDRNGWHGKISTKSGEGTSNLGTMAGGDANNVVMSSLTIHAEARSHDPRFRAKIVAEFDSAFRKAAQEVQNIRGDCGAIEFQAEVKYDSFRLPDDAPAVVEASAAVRRAGGEPRCVVGNGGLDANWMHAHGLTTVTLGCGQHDIHTVAESLDVEEFLTACQIGLDLATGDVRHG
ncbi:MAG: M20/M25/M40 family metallo-hydrolase [Planctomycetaceae bacterium]